MSLTRRLDRLEHDAQQREAAGRRELLPYLHMSDEELTRHIEAELARLTPAEQAAFWAEWEADYVQP